MRVSQELFIYGLDILARYISFCKDQSIKFLQASDYHSSFLARLFDFARISRKFKACLKLDNVRNGHSFDRIVFVSQFGVNI